MPCLEEYELLKETLSPSQLTQYELGSDLSSEQKIAFEKFKNGENILIIGPGGSGKSFLLRTIQEYNMQFFRDSDYRRLYMTATTGVAAYNLNFSDNVLSSSGMTLHSFLGIGTGEQDIYGLVRKVSKSPSIVNIIKSPHILVIDEISLLSASLFEKINLIYRHFRKSKEFFGGIQVVMLGDFLQTEAIFNEKNNYTDNELDKRLLFESDTFNDMFPEHISFTQNHRQKDDIFYSEMLSRIRIGQHTQDDIILLKKKCLNFTKELKNVKQQPLHLVVSNAEALRINKKNMDEIPESYTVYNVLMNSFGQNTDLINTMKRDLEKQFTAKGLLKLSLKKGARIMLIRNIDVSMGLINGSMGHITEMYKTEITVSFDNGKITNIPRNEWALEIDNCFVKFRQFPIVCSYAITIHKSISLTLDYTTCDLAKCFCNHLVYLAMSRVKTFDKLLLKSFNPDKITVNKKILEYLKIK